MGFYTFNEAFYLQELRRLERGKLSKAEVYRAKQILKVLDDLTDEGYTDLNCFLERKHHCITRLRRVIAENGGTPFAIAQRSLPKAEYSGEYELASFLDRFAQNARQSEMVSQNPFLSALKDYCGWIGLEKGTAYIFLLRDALLPYLYYKNRDGKSLYPWLISRRFLYQITGEENLDDDLRLPIYEALENGLVDYAEFRGFCKKRVLGILNQYPGLKAILIGLLDTVKEEKIMVVESGYCGTIPMLLSALDDRVDFRLYTTAPFLYETYRPKLYCQKYEHIRLFETLYSHDLLTQYSSYRYGQFFIQAAANEDITRQAEMEAKYILGQKN